MKNLVFAANLPMYKKFLFYFNLKASDYRFVDSKDAIKNYNHRNSHFILTDGYPVNPGFATDRYLLVCKFAKDEGKLSEFIERKFMKEIK